MESIHLFDLQDKYFCADEGFDCRRKTGKPVKMSSVDTVYPQNVLKRERFQTKCKISPPKLNTEFELRELKFPKVI